MPKKQREEQNPKEDKHNVAGLRERIGLLSTTLLVPLGVFKG